MRRNQADAGDQAAGGATESGDRDAASSSRRTALEGVGTFAGAGALASSAARATAPSIPSRLRDQFDRIVDVTDAGADDAGDRSITGALESLRDADELQYGTLLYFPPGRYYVDRQFRMTGFDRFGMYGDDATFVPATCDDVRDGHHRLFRLGAGYDPGRRLHVENFAVDQTAAGTGVRAFETVVSERLDVHDVDVVGRHDTGAWGPGRFVVADRNGTGVVSGFRATDGGAYPANAARDAHWRGPTGVLANDNEGRLTFRDCELGGFPDDGLCAAGSDGRIRVRRGTYRNSDGANVRVGGPNSEIRGVDVVVDRNRPETTVQRGIRVERTSGVVVGDCRVRIATDTPNSPALSIRWDAEDAYVKNTALVMDSRVPNHAVRVAAGAGDVTFYGSTVETNAPGGCGVYLDGEGTDDERAVLAQVAVTGDAGHESNRAAIYNVRNNVEFRGVEVDQTGGDDRRGVENLGDDCAMYGCDVRARQYPLVDAASGTWVENGRFVSAGDWEGVRLAASSANVHLTHNHVAGGVRDDGCAGLELVGNTFA